MTTRLVRVEDLVWLALFAALHLASPVRTPAELEILVGLALFQAISPRFGWFSTPTGNLVSIGVKLLLGWLLIGVTYGVESSYFPILLLPVVSAATTLSGWGTALTTLLAAGAYLSFLLFLDWNRYEVPPDQARELALRVLFLPLVAFLTHQLARANRAESSKYRKAAADLEEANRHLREAEDAMRRADRLAALGQLTAGLAHELRNPLGTIRSSAELLAKRLPAGDGVGRELSGFITSETDRANSLMVRFLDFARPLELRREPVAAAGLLDEAVSEIERRNPPPTARVVKNYSPDLRPIAVDGELMRRVFVNLIANATEASPAGGVVTVRTREIDGGVEVAVIDRGGGVAPAHRESVFNPFFTTKPSGVGLGLPIAAKIVNEHGGRLDFDSAPGEGSVFRVWIPPSAS